MEADMYNSQIDVFSGIVREHQEEIRQELRQQAMLNEGLVPQPGLKRRVLVSLAATVVIITIAVVAGAQFI
jgi:hypothetical protein